MSEKQYKIYYPAAQILLPALGSLYFILTFKFDLPNETGVLGTIMVLKLITSIYFWQRNRNPDGTIIISQNKAGKKLFSLELQKTPEELEKMGNVTFRIIPMDPDTIVLFPPKIDDS